MLKTDSQAISIVADIGGTHARFAYVARSETELQTLISFSCGDYPELLDAIRAYLKKIPSDNLQQVCLAVAAPLVGDWINMPNNHWAFSQSALAQSLSCPVNVINDFTAQALSLKALRATDFQMIGELMPTDKPASTRAILGPGTGLGVAALLANGEPLVSEAGHIGFAPVTEHEVQILKQLWHAYERVSVERLLSGKGLENLYWANSRLTGVEREFSAGQVTAGARDGDALCRQAIADFCAVLGSVAGDVALMMGAYGGVFLSGGMLGKMQDLVDWQLLRQRFDYKGRYSEICRSIPLAIVTAEHPGLKGAAQAVFESHAFENYKGAEVNKVSENNKVSG